MTRREDDATVSSRSLPLDAPVTELPRVGPATASSLKRLGVVTVGDLLRHAPASYVDYRTIVKVAAAPLGTPVALMGRCTSIATRRSFKRRQLVVTEGIFQDKSGALPVVWFSRYALKTPPAGETVYLTGSITLSSGRRQLTNPSWETAAVEPQLARRMVPVYPLTAGLSQWQIRRLVAAALATVVVEDPLPADVMRHESVLPLDHAYRALHAPQTPVEAGKGRFRLAVDELVVIHLAQNLVRKERERLVARPVRATSEVLRRVTSLLPFHLHAAQLAALHDALGDMAQTQPMMRLLQGEVGSGKTAVAGIAAAITALNGMQTLFLAPTDVLARQHYATLAGWFSESGIPVGLLTASGAETTLGDTSRRTTLAAITRGDCAMTIGTHALFRALPAFRALGFVVVDEQHRFGVLERLAAQQGPAGTVPHVLSMSATPIPRTLQFVSLGDLARSELRSAARGGRNVKTALVMPDKRAEMERRLRRRVTAGEQAYVVCPLIDPSDALAARAASVEYERLRSVVFPNVPVGYLHGRMRAADKQAALEQFRSGATRVLVTTTVVEVGVDVPEATIMIIEGAERFGLAQLHQLRGRVGRSGAEGFCLLVVESSSASALARLRLFAKTTDAFALAQADLKLRGPGEWFGQSQSGFPDIKYADLSDTRLVATARRIADRIDASRSTPARLRLLTKARALLPYALKPS